MFTRTRYQYGSLETKERKKGKEVWEFRYYETDGRGERQRRAIMVGSLEEYPTESAARKSPAVQAILLRLNAEQPAAVAGTAEFGAVIARYEKEEMPERYSTRSAYKSYIKNYIRPRWADTPMSAVRPMAVEDWLKDLDLAPKTKSHVRSLMHTIFQCAERWELTAKNPIKLVRVKGGTKRLKTPRVLTPEQFELLLPPIREPFRTMVLVAGCLGLRVSEIVALQWADFDFSGLTLLVQRSIVHGRIGEAPFIRYGCRRPADILAGVHEPRVRRGRDCRETGVGGRRFLASGNPLPNGLCEKPSSLEDARERLSM